MREKLLSKNLLGKSKMLPVVVVSGGTVLLVKSLKEQPGVMYNLRGGTRQGQNTCL